MQLKWSQTYLVPSLFWKLEFFQNHCRCWINLFVESIVAPVSSSNGTEQTSGKDTDSLRICNHCLDMLESRRKAQIEQMIQPMICQLYSHLQKSKQHIQNSVDMYYKVIYTYFFTIINVYFVNIVCLQLIIIGRSVFCFVNIFLGN